MLFDATKVTYNTYSNAISSMSREMMKMDGNSMSRERMKRDGRDSAECQNWEQKDKMVIFGIVK